MAGAIEIDVQDEALLAALQTKPEQLPDKLNDLVNEIGFIVQRHAMDEAPYITHNLEASIRVEENGPLGRIVYPDQGVAPYALYVILGHMTRPAIKYPERSEGQHFIEGNDFLDRASDASEAEIDAEVERFEQWCSDLG